MLIGPIDALVGDRWIFTTCGRSSGQQRRNCWSGWPDRGGRRVRSVRVGSPDSASHPSGPLGGWSPVFADAGPLIRPGCFQTCCAVQVVRDRALGLLRQLTVCCFRTFCIRGR